MCKYSEELVVEALVNILTAKNILTESELMDEIVSIRKIMKISVEEETITTIKTGANKKELSPLEEAEKAIILQTLHDFDGNKSETARRLNITRKTLLHKLNKYSGY